MTRVPSPQETEGRRLLIKELKKDIGRPKVIKRGGYFTLGNCCLGTVILIGIILFILVVGVAKSGLVNIPVATNVFYRTPEPTRFVYVSEEEIKNIDAVLTKKISQQLFSLVRQGSNTVVSLELNERELTALINKYLTTADKSNNINITGAQLAILDDELEFFGWLVKPLGTHVTLGLKPTFNGKRLGIKLTKAKLGQTPIPTFLLNFAVTNAFNGPLKGLESELNENVKIQSFVVTNGLLVISGEIKN